MQFAHSMRQTRHSIRVLAIASTLLLGAAIASGDTQPCARFERLATLRCGLAATVPGESPWSPQGDLVAVIKGEASGTTTLAVFDVTKPLVAPRELLSMPHPIGPVCWSPDGKWIACIMRLRTQKFIWVVRVRDGACQLAGVADAWPFLWASDRVLLGFRFEDGAEVLRFDPSPGAGADSLDEVPRLTMIGHPTAGFGAAKLTLWPRPTITPLPALSRVLLYGTFPDRRRFIINRLGEGGGVAVVDANGTILAEIGTRMSPGSATADGRFVAGFHGVEDGYNYLSAEVYLHEVSSAREIPVQAAPHSTGVECSPVGPWLALESLREGLVIGRLIVSTCQSR